MKLPSINPYLPFLLLTLLMLGSGKDVLAQQESQYTQYMYNANTINPAFAGTRGVLSFNSTLRSQWVGLEGAPQTLSFSVNTPMGNKGVGLGMSYFNDKIGPTQESNIAFDFSYTFRVTYDAMLSLGLKGGMNNLNVNTDLLHLFNEFDPNMQPINVWSPTVGVGAYLHSHNWYLGLSTPNMLETSHYEEVAVSTATEKAHFYLMGGYVFEMGPDWHFKPTFLGKAVSGAPLSVDVSANFMYQEKFIVGASYRWDAAVTAMAGFQINDSIMIGYAYDYDTHDIGNFNSGSHEVFLQFELGTRQRDLRAKRCFF